MTFSESPIYLLTTVLGVRLMRLEDERLAIYLMRMVLPLPGGPYNMMPFGGDLNPVNISGLKLGSIIHSHNISFTSVNPIISSTLKSSFFINIPFII